MGWKLYRWTAVVWARLKRFHRIVETSPVFQTKYNIFFMYFWLANMIMVTPVFFFMSSFWQKASVFYLVQVSLWANVATHYGAVSAAESSDAAHDAAAQ